MIFSIINYYRYLTRTSDFASINLDGKKGNMLKKLLSKLLTKKKETKPRDFEWERFQKEAREQFQKLKDKGLSIPVVTL